MITILPFRRRRGVRLTGLPHGSIRVTRVTADADPTGWTYWTFDAPVTGGVQTPGNLCVKVAGVWLQPLGYGVDGDVLQLCYATDQVLIGSDWSILKTPTGLDEATEILVPQLGKIE